MSENKKRFYTVVRGRVPGIYNKWFGPGGAQEQVRGYADAVFRGFATLEEARGFMADPKSRHSSGKPVRQNTSWDDNDQDEQERPVHIYTDGGCIDNPGPGGFGAVIIEGDKRTEISGGYRLTTNNRMELTACIQALNTLRKGSHVILFTDSQYVANAVTKGWAAKWRSRNWMRDKTHKAVNSDLWAELLTLLARHDVVFRWVRGHAGNPENERCDVLARQAAQRKDLTPDTGYENSMNELRESKLF